MLLILLVALTLVFAAVLWLGSVFLQGWLYNDLARRLPLRALAGGAVLALFHTGWCAVYKADPGRFDTLANFKTEALDGTYDEFQSVRKVGKEEKKPVRFVRRGESNDVRVAGDRPAVESVRRRRDGGGPARQGEGEGHADPVRRQPGPETANFRPPEETRYEAEGGRRYMDHAALGKVYRVRSMAYLGNIFANLLHLAVWVAVLWPVMRFTLGHAVGIGLAPVGGDDARRAAGPVRAGDAARGGYRFARMCMMSPSWTTYSFDSCRRVPFVLQCFSSYPAARKSG